MKGQPIECVSCGTTCTPWRNGLLCGTCQWQSVSTWDKVRKQRVIEMLFEIATPTCAYCGDELTLTTYSLDHIIPKSRGGSHDRNNLTWACRDCNSTKQVGGVA